VVSSVLLPALVAPGSIGAQFKKPMSAAHCIRPVETRGAARRDVKNRTAPLR
jgi:hypothetical protein